MKITLLIVSYILTFVFSWVMASRYMRKEKDKVTIGDILTEIPWLMYVPIINTIILIIALIKFFVWQLLGIKKFWNKVKDIEL